MKLTFFHDGPAFLGPDGIYYEFSYHGLLERYNYLADEIVFVMRVEPLPENASLTPIPTEIKIVEVPNFKKPTKYFYEIGNAKKIIKEAVKQSDIVIARGSSCAHIAIKYAKKFNKPYIYECVGCFWDSLWNYNTIGKAMAPFSFMAARRLIRNSDYVYYVTDKFLQRRYPTRGKSVNCSNVQIEPTSSVVLEKRLKKINDLRMPVVLGTAAAIDVRYKGQEYVIKAIPDLAKNGIEVEYWLAGSNAHNSAYLQEVADSEGVGDKVKLLGSLNKDQIKTFYDSIDIYIQPSKQEGLPRSVIEAMSRGCPVLGTRVAGIPELISDDCLFEKGSSEAAAAAICNILHGDLSNYAKCNFEKAKQYEKQVLKKRREAFYDVFLAEQSV